MHGQHTARLQMAKVELKRLARQQMDRNRIAGKGVHCEDVVVLRALAFHRKARVAHHHFSLRLAFGKKPELSACYVDDQRIDFVEAVEIASSSVSRYRTCTQPDYPDAQPQPTLCF